MNTNKRIVCEIAKISIEFFTTDINLNLIVNPGLTKFISIVEKIDYQIEVKVGIPYNLENENIVFQANVEAGEFYKKDAPYWAIALNKGKTLVFAACELAKIYPFSVLEIPSNKSNTMILYINNSNKNKKHINFYPFQNPMGPLLLYYITAFNNAFMIHASAVKYKGKGLLFSGFSGVGKSTISDIFCNENAKLINDDRIIIKKESDGFYAYNSPMFYEATPQVTKLNYIFLLKQFPSNYIKPIEGVLSLSRIMAFCIQHDYDKILVSNLLDLLSDLTISTKIFELGFVPNRSVVSFVEKIL